MEGDRRSGGRQRSDAAEAFERRRLGFERFSRWESEHPAVLSPSGAIAAVAFLYSLLPSGSRVRPVDTTGVATLHRRLAGLRPRR